MPTTQPAFPSQWAFALFAALILALTLGALGPALDAPPPDSAAASLLPEGEVARLEAEARHLCAAQRGDNGAVLQLADGAVYCADKHGRRGAHSIITIAEKATP
jgi:hypothetical protein